MPDCTQSTAPRPDRKPIPNPIVELLRRHHDVLVTADKLPMPANTQEDRS